MNQDVHASGDSSVEKNQSTSPYVDLKIFQWNSGARSCEQDVAPKIQVVRAAKNSYVLRQNKCTTFEAPFLYLLIGETSAVLVDTGAIESSEESPIYTTVNKLIAQASGVEKPLLVVHSHSHSDHTKGDSQFIGKDMVSVVGKYQHDIIDRFGLDDWPAGQAEIDLGGRGVTILPIPGHQDQSIAIYDSQTQWLLTGDTLYPGSIRVKDWNQFKASIKRLSEFAISNTVSMVLGAHIEMNAQTSKIYSIGSTYQPHEMPLALPIEALYELNSKLQKQKKSKKLKFSSFQIDPLSYFEKMIIKAMTPKPPKQN
jgi:glyoxylase-like metal-dependent hydrolase (beta-lactamase superfamily II)